jgi:hypothetical protein
VDWLAQLPECCDDGEMIRGWGLVVRDPAQEVFQGWNLSQGLGEGWRSQEEE